MTPTPRRRSRAFGWTLERNSASHYDAVDEVGTRFQIKGRRVGNGPRSRQLGILRHLLAAVLSDHDMKVLRAALIPHRIVAERAVCIIHTNGWRLMPNDAVWQLPTLRDATDAERSL